MDVLANELTIGHREILLDVVERTVRGVLTHEAYYDPHVDWYPVELQNIRACFVSLRSGDRLLGSIGTTHPSHPLVVDAARNAFELASLVLQQCQLTDSRDNVLQLELVVLSPLETITVSTFDEIAQFIQQGRDGVCVSCLDCSATFLPSMWQKFTDPSEFLQQLWLRAGLDPKSWQAETQVAKFSTQCFTRNLELTLTGSPLH